MKTKYILLALINCMSVYSVLFGSTQSTAIQLPQSTPISTIQPTFTIVPFKKHTIISAPTSFHYSITRTEWENAQKNMVQHIEQIFPQLVIKKAAQGIIYPFSVSELLYSFNIWCQRLKSDAHKEAQRQKIIDAHLAAPVETPAEIYIGLIYGERPFIEKPQQPFKL
ncbi:hypothetical protein HYV10_03815 [Candidatus Dependentiae bacterium]|nr:hypothetical protein [Candidatus Dependentiae bacterium]